MADLGFVDEGARPLDNFEPIPPGPYKAMIVESDVKETQNRDGRRLSLTWEIVEGEHTGRKIFGGVNIQHKTAKAQEIGQRELASIRMATGVLSPRNSEELHGKPCWIDVKITPERFDEKTGKTYQSRNEIRRYENLANAAPAPSSTPAPAAASTYAAQQAATAAPAQAPAGAGTNVAPWLRGRK